MEGIADKRVHGKGRGWRWTTGRQWQMVNNAIRSRPNSHHCPPCSLSRQARLHALQEELAGLEQSRLRDKVWGVGEGGE